MHWLTLIWPLWIPLKWTQVVMAANCLFILCCVRIYQLLPYRWRCRKATSLSLTAVLQFAKIPNVILLLPAQQPSLSKQGRIFLCVLWFAYKLLWILWCLLKILICQGIKGRSLQKLGSPKASSAKLTQCFWKSCQIYTFVVTISYAMTLFRLI